jgi:hypothetical protein
MPGVSRRVTGVILPDYLSGIQLIVCQRARRPGQARHTVYDGERLAGFSTYKLTDRRITFTHTEIASEFSGRGLARRRAARRPGGRT